MTALCYTVLEARSIYSIAEKRGQDRQEADMKQNKESNRKQALASSVDLQLLNFGVLRKSRAFLARQDENGFWPTPAD